MNSLQAKRYCLLIKNKWKNKLNLLIPLGKSFWKKQTKTIKGQGEKQIKVIQKLGQIKTIKKYAYDDKDSLLISKQKELFNKLADERLEEITKFNNKGGKISLADKKKMIK